MNLRFVEAFVWVARLKSITRGAERLFLTQSAVSNRVAALEQELGITLLDRRERSFKLTLAGARFLQYAERLLALQREIKTELGSPEQLPLSLRIGGNETALHTWLIPMIDLLKKSNPQLELDLTIETTPVLVEQLRRGGLDLTFTVLPALGEQIEHETLTPLEMVFVGPASMTRKRALSVRELLACDLMTFQRGSAPHVALLDLLRSLDAAGKRVHTVSSISAMVRLVEGGFGIAALPRAAIVQMLPRSRLAILRCDCALAPLPMVASYWRDPAAPELAKALHEALAFVRAQ
ncbi:MAG: LysR family transcriptional regulator [Burkholderiaceae bacterium]|nr:MAG: LysR family transcriptional regulator [Burkholderiaceae bacterium]